MTKHFYKIIFITLFCNLGVYPPLSAQNKTALSKIILSQGDTLVGSIQKSNNYFHQIKFKADKDSDYKTYLPENLQGFILENRAYYSSQSLKLGNENRQKFLQVAVEGEASLYFYKEAGELYCFVKKGNELIQIEENRLLNLLNLAFGDCESMNLRNNTPLNELKKKYVYNLNSLSQNTLEYNRCKATELPTVLRYTPYKLRISGGIKLGARASSMYFKDIPFSANDNKSSPPSIFGGWFLNFSFSPAISAQMEMLYVSQKLNATARYLVDQFPQVAKLNTRISYLQIPLLLQYNLMPDKKIQVFINTGASLKLGIPILRSFQTTKNEVFYS